MQSAVRGIGIFEVNGFSARERHVALGLETRVVETAVIEQAAAQGKWRFYGISSIS